MSIAWIYEVKLPKGYEKLLDAISFLFPDVSFSTECIFGPLSFKTLLLANTVGPFVACLLVVLLGMLWDRCKGKGRLTDRTTFACAQLVLLIVRAGVLLLDARRGMLLLDARRGNITDLRLLHVNEHRHLPSSAQVRRARRSLPRVLEVHARRLLYESGAA